MALVFVANAKWSEPKFTDLRPEEEIFQSVSDGSPGRQAVTLPAGSMRSHGTPSPAGRQGRQRGREGRFGRRGGTPVDARRACRHHSPKSSDGILRSRT